MSGDSTSIRELLTGGRKYGRVDRKGFIDVLDDEFETCFTLLGNDWTDEQILQVIRTRDAAYESGRESGADWLQTQIRNLLGAPSANDVKHIVDEVLQDREEREIAISEGRSRW